MKSPTRLSEYFDRKVPRYTSYPTAPHFSAAVDGACYASWLEAIKPQTALSLYLHIPFCRSMCWFCGCHTRIVRRYEPVAAYLDTLCREIDLIAGLLPGDRPVGHIHWGGGTPTIVTPDDWMRIDNRLRRRFDVSEDAEIAVEIDPRTVSDDHLAALAATGVTRASIGVQDFDAEVQQAVNRIQPLAMTAHLIDRLRERGIDGIGLDLIYGLPHQTASSVAETAEQAAKLRPGRIALFGYAHVPWMKRHQRLIDEAALPDSEARWAEFSAAARCLAQNGYRAVGLDHFALPDDPLALAASAGTLRRNFQGYTVDTAPALLGFGASAIGRLEQGYVQNAVPVADWREAIDAGRPATVRGFALGDEDRARAEAIERLMCDMRVDLAALRRRYALAPGFFRADLEDLAPLIEDGIVRLDGETVSVAERGRPLLRIVAAAFDARLTEGEGRHVRAV